MWLALKDRMAHRSTDVRNKDSTVDVRVGGGVGVPDRREACVSCRGAAKAG